MPEERLGHRVRGVIVSQHQDGVTGIAIDKHDEVFLSIVGRWRSHNVHGERVPWTLRLYGPHRLLAVAIIAPHLTLGTTLRDLYAKAATGFE